MFLRSMKTLHLYRHELHCAKPRCPASFAWSSVVSWLGVEAADRLDSAGWVCRYGQWFCFKHRNGGR